MIINPDTAIKKTIKQVIAWAMLAKHLFTLLYGGSRSGKTFIIIYCIVYRALMIPGSKHLIIRKTIKSVNRTIYKNTLKAVLDILCPNGFGYTKNDSNRQIDFSNGSRILCEGLDNNRVEEILGDEYLTIFFNEVSQLMYSVIEIVLTRLAQKCTYEVNGQVFEARRKAFFDCNPPNKRHWSYQWFFEKVNPETREISAYKDTATLMMNPDDNLDNIGENYIDILEGMSASKRKRFLLGEFLDDTDGALWMSKWIYENRIVPDKSTGAFDLPDAAKYYIAIDPAVTSKETSDETGIIYGFLSKVKGEDHIYIIGDLSGIMRMEDWAQIAYDEYQSLGMDKIVAEVNQGGDLVERNIRVIDNNISYKGVRASRGKAIRAEPVANMYRLGRVHHVGQFPELENELTSWVPDSGDVSPNRLDALVWLVAALLDFSFSGVNNEVSKKTKEAMKLRRKNTKRKFTAGDL